MPTSQTQALSIEQWFQAETSRIMDDLGMFFAFGNKQFAEKAVDGEDYVAIGGGMYGPRANADKLNTQLNELIDLKAKKEIEKDGLKEIIVRELYNRQLPRPKGRSLERSDSQELG